MANKKSNTARYIKASQAEKLRQYFEEIYIRESVAAISAEDDRRDDPGDWYTDTEIIEECHRLANEASNFADLFGGIDTQYCHKEINHRFYG